MATKVHREILKTITVCIR